VGAAARHGQGALRALPLLGRRANRRGEILPGLRRGHKKSPKGIERMTRQRDPFSEDCLELLRDVHQFTKDSVWVSFERGFNGYTDDTVKDLQRLGLIEARIDAGGFTVRLTDRGARYLR
jgi:hypothetical protein